LKSFFEGLKKLKAFELKIFKREKKLGVFYSAIKKLCRCQGALIEREKRYNKTALKLFPAAHQSGHFSPTSGAPLIPFSKE
jgi:hypothetical protein